MLRHVRGDVPRLTHSHAARKSSPQIRPKVGLYWRLLERTKTLGGVTVSRIWRALREAESYKSRSTSRGPAARSTVSELRSREAADRRGSKRTIEAVLLLVYGSDEDKQPFHEESKTLDIAENGCSFLIEAPVSQGQRLFLANTVNQAELQARVVHVGRRVRGKARIGVEFLRAAPEFWYSE
jgi:hypothetical protein